MTAAEVLQLSVVLAAVAAATSASQVLVSRRDFEPGGPFDLSRSPGSPRVRRVLARLHLPLTPRLIQAISLVRIGVAVTVCIPAIPAPIRALAAFVALILSVTTTQFQGRYLTWSEQVGKIILGSAGLAWLVGTERAASYALWFQASQLALLYAAAGAFKLGSRQWRTGDALWRIIGREVSGHPRLGEWLRRHPAWTVALSWCTMTWEVLFPLALVLPPPFVLAFLVVGVAFHLGCAYSMGLNTYGWPCIAAYPAVLHANAHVRQWF